MAGHSPLLIVLCVVILLLFIANQVLSLVENIVQGARAVLYNNASIGQLSDKKFIEITPSSPTFSIWAVIYVWQLVWLIYALVNICRRAPGGPVYTSPVILTPAFFAVSIFNWMCVISWTFAWCWEFEWVAFILLFLTAFSIYVEVGLSYKALDKHKEMLIKEERKLEIWLVRMFVQNGLAFYGTWCTIATLLNLAAALTYDEHPKFDQSTSSTVALSILAAELIFYSLSDWTVLDKYSRYTFSPYIVVIVALSGSIVKNWNPLKRNSIFTAALLGVAIACFVVKMILMFWRHFRDNDRRKVILATTETKEDLKL